MNVPEEKPVVETPEEPSVDETRKIEASRRGWKPEEEYNGAPGTWRDFDEFLKVGDEIDLHRQNKHLKAQLNDLQTTVDKFQPFMEKSIAKAKGERDQAIADLEAMKAQAIGEGDGQTVVKADKQIAALQAEQQQAVPEQKPLTPAQKAFVARNQDWFQVDSKMTQYADSLGDQILQANPGISEREYFQELETAVRMQFAPAGPGPSAVSSPSPPAKRGKAHIYANLDAAGKQACDEFVATIPGFTKEQYCATYEWDD